MQFQLLHDVISLHDDGLSLWRNQFCVTLSNFRDIEGFLAMRKGFRKCLLVSNSNCPDAICSNRICFDGTCSNGTCFADTSFDGTCFDGTHSDVNAILHVKLDHEERNRTHGLPWNLQRSFDKENFTFVVPQLGVAPHMKHGWKRRLKC